MFEIKFTENAYGDLKCFKKNEQTRILGAIENHLRQQAISSSRNRKKLRSNDLSGWELRVGDFRIFYDVNEEEMVVNIRAIGYKKHNQLFIRDEEYDL